MPPRLFVLAAATFATGTGTFVFSGLLEPMAADLGVSVALAGQLATAFTVAFALGAPVAASLLAGLDRKKVLVTALLAVAALNALSALAPDFASLFGLRVLTGLAATCVGPVASVAAVALAPVGQTGRALAAVMAGLTLSFILGIPLGSVVGAAFGWRATFAFAAIIAVAAAGLILALLPPVPRTADGRGRAAFAALAQGPVLHLLAISLIAFAATFSVVAFIGPVVTASTGLTGAGVGAMQAFVGVGSLIGLAIGGRLADRTASARPVAVIFAVMTVTLALYVPLTGGVLSGMPAKVLLAAVITSGAACLFALIPLVSARLSVAASDARMLAFAVNGSVISFGQGLGAVLGGLAGTVGGLAAHGLVGAMLALCGLGLVLAAGARAARLEATP
jgi:DHA1 family inner membrane transport protein